jgi:hypothetical protein
MLYPPTHPVLPPSACSYAADITSHPCRIMLASLQLLPLLTSTLSHGGTPRPRPRSKGSP